MFPTMWIISDYWRNFNHHWRWGFQFCIEAAFVAERMLLVVAQAWLRKSIPEDHWHVAKDRSTCSEWIQKFTNPFACPNSYTCWSEVCILMYVLYSFVPMHTCSLICQKILPKQYLFVLHVCNILHTLSVRKLFPLYRRKYSLYQRIPQTVRRYFS